ncbi:MAG TPA: lamin tail domain-containing protein [Kofleriaceae bacterium]|nr:lamin tail domain-containing protein [Kofleriaceae bacterium]
MKAHVVVCLALVAGCSGSERSEKTASVDQGLYDCASPAQRLTCDPPDDPTRRFVCHATSGKHPFVKISVDLTSTAHVPGQSDGNGAADQAPGASANDLGGPGGLDCFCQPRVCIGTCTGAAAGTACDDDDRCTGDGTCNGDTCEPGTATCVAGTPIDACNEQSGACDGETGECFSEPLPAGTTCATDNVCNGDGSCVECVDNSQCDSGFACSGGTCVGVPHVTINEIESSGGVPGDWIELTNTGTAAADVSGWRLLDNDNTHAPYVIPAGTIIPIGGYVVVDEAQFVFGLGAADSARLFDATNTLVDTYSWAAHAVTTYGRCPDGTGAFTTTTSPTKGTANDCSIAIKINEVESSGGVPGDWVELFNAGPVSVDLSGFIFRDNDDTHAYAIPAGTTLAPGTYYVLDEAAFGFGLGAADSARLFDTTNAVIDAYSWTTHAVTTYGRCPNGTGSFTTMPNITKGTANDCANPVRINEVESSGGVPGDWIELRNNGAAPKDVSGWRVLDNDDTHLAYVIPAGTTIPAGGYVVVEEAQFGFGLGAADSARLFDSSSALVDSYSWTAHAVTTYGRCPNGTGPFTTTTSVTKGAANDCTNAIRINEVESNGGVPGDWVELFNAGPLGVDVSGWIFRDNDDTHAYAIPAGTTIAPGAYYLLEEAAFGFGLGAADSARLFDGSGTVVDAYSWTTHAAITYGRCPNGSGAFAATSSSTKGAANGCGGGGPTGSTWPGRNAVVTVDAAGAPNNVSGLFYDGATLWGARNAPGELIEYVQIGTQWNIASQRTLRYPSGLGDPDAEDVTKAELSSNAIYVATERDNANNAVSRLSILRFDTSAAGTTLIATHEWNLTADIPAVGANLGLEAITWIPDSFLVGAGFFDTAAGHAYNPADYANHGTGLFFVGVEQTGTVYVYALDHAGDGYTRVTSFASGDPATKALYFDRDVGYLWTYCGAACGNQSGVMRINASGAFALIKQIAAPSTMPNLQNEGISFAPESQCVAGQKSFWWTDDGATDGHALRADTIPCGAF